MASSESCTQSQSQQGLDAMDGAPGAERCMVETFFRRSARKSQHCRQCRLPDGLGSVDMVCRQGRSHVSLVVYATGRLAGARYQREYGGGKEKSECFQELMR